MQEISVTFVNSRPVRDNPHILDCANWGARCPVPSAHTTCRLSLALSVSYNSIVVVLHSLVSPRQVRIGVCTLVQLRAQPGPFAGWEDEDGLLAIIPSLQPVLSMLTKMPTLFFACSMHHAPCTMRHAPQNCRRAIQYSTVVHLCVQVELLSYVIHYIHNRRKRY